MSLGSILLLLLGLSQSIQMIEVKLQECPKGVSVDRAAALDGLHELVGRIHRFAEFLSNCLSRGFLWSLNPVMQSPHKSVHGVRRMEHFRREVELLRQGSADRTADAAFSVVDHAKIPYEFCVRKRNTIPHERLTPFSGSSFPDAAVDDQHCEDGSEQQKPTHPVQAVPPFRPATVGHLVILSVFCLAWPVRLNIREGN